MSDPDLQDMDVVFGISPLGCNAVEGAVSSCDAAVRDTTTHGVPLVYDDITGEYVAEIARQEQEDRLVDLEHADGHTQEQSFLQQVGFTNSV